MNIRQYIQPSALFLEGVEKLNQNSIANVYCGFNVTKTNNEPIDQIQAFIAAKRIQEYNQDRFGRKGLFISFIGGLFEVLNCKKIEEVNALIERNAPKEASKKRLFQSIYKQFDIQGEVLTTADLWQDQRYWEILKGLFDTKIFTRGLLINDALAFYESKEQLFSALKVKGLPSTLVNLPLDFIKKIGNFPAPLLYTPAEVSEAYYLKEKYGISTKIGQAQERIYDKYLYRNFSVFRLKQPVSLTSSLTKPEVVTPYIDKSNFELSGLKKTELRLYFNDSFSEVTKKVSTCSTQEYACTTENSFGEVFNPVLEKAIFAVESARAMKKTPVMICDQEFSSGEQLVNAVLNAEISLKNVQSELSKIITQFIIEPMKENL